MDTISIYLQLWFGDERGYNATHEDVNHIEHGLWFGDERGYNATFPVGDAGALGCGLVMKEDITQQAQDLHKM